MKNNNIIAKLNKVRSSPQKLRLVSKLLINKKVNDAKLSLTFINNKAARLLNKAIQSAVSNAIHNYQLASTKLIIKQITINNGPSLKRLFPRAKGKIDHIIKRTSNITIILVC